MSGLLFGAIAGGMSGAGKAGVAALGELQKYEQNKTLEELRAELMYQKQARLAELTNKHQRSFETEIKQPFLEKQQKAGFTHDKELESGRQKHTEDLQAARLTFEGQWNDKNFKLRQQEIAATRDYQAKSLGLQRAALDKNSIWQDPKTGAYWVVDDRTKEVKKAFNDPTTNKQMVGTIPLNDSTKMMVEGSFGMAAALAKSLDPEERKLGDAYFQFGTRMLAAGDADARSVPPAAKVAQYVEAIKSGDKALIDKAKSDFVAKYPLLGQTVVDSFATLEGTGKAPKTPGVPPIIDGAKPIPENAPAGIVERARAGEAAAAARVESEAKTKADREADVKARTGDVDWLTPTRIRGLTKEQAREYRQKYWDVMTPEQRKAVTLQTDLGPIDKR